ncbi:P-loop NTPase fold protein [Brachymonas sp. M4Q-1]|uniref:P-loop NTPase fold protein n=1 Tax=Brachymonas sp. M4Q-1 TaxID=3416906 RepID=UPI003CEE9650
MWHDNETTTDYLNFGVVADACAKLLQQANGQPISIGVSGGWGVGKSSLVHLHQSGARSIYTPIFTCAALSSVVACNELK